MKQTTLQYLLQVARRRGAGYLPLLDPDRLSMEELERRIVLCADADADAVLVGTSFMVSDRQVSVFERVKRLVDIPVICFPGNAGHLSPDADAVLFLSLVSGRNPELLVGEHVRAAPLLKEAGVEVISTGYILVESGALTSVQYTSGTLPIPRAKPDIAMATALAAEYIGMKLIYLEAGSGATEAVPAEMVRSVVDCVSVPVIVGGGIRDAVTAGSLVEAGAQFVVTGQALESDQDDLLSTLRELSAAVHTGD